MKTMGMNIMIWACLGSPVVGVIFCCSTIVAPMKIGVM